MSRYGPILVASLLLFHFRVQVAGAPSSASDSTDGHHPGMVHSAAAPDHSAVVSWFDGEETSEQLAPRTIVLFDSRTNSLILHITTTERWTGAAWSPDSRTTVIFNAPDNANVWIWLVQRERDNWITGRFNLLEAIEKLPRIKPLARDDTPEHPGLDRGGIEGIRWDGNAALIAHITFNNADIRTQITWEGHDFAHPRFELLDLHVEK